MTLDRKKLTVASLAIADQAWQYLDDHLGDLQRIAIWAPRETSKERLIRKALLLVVAELYTKRANRECDIG